MAGTKPDHDGEMATNEIWIASSLPLLAMTNAVSARYFLAMSGGGEWVRS